MNIEYSRYLVAYLDILGFRQLCRSSDETGNTAKLNEIYRICSRSINELREADGKRDIKSLVISDSIILGMTPSKGRLTFDAKEVADFLLAVGRIQFNLFKAEILLRGGVSIGNAFFDLNEKIVVGPAFVDAYELETKLAVYPRVIVTPRLVSELGLETQVDFILLVNEQYKYSKQRPLFNWDSTGDSALCKLVKDVPFFVDFIRSESGDIVQIRKRCDETVDLVNRMALRETDHYSKYRWLEDYWLTTYGQVHGRYNGRTVTSLMALHD